MGLCNSKQLKDRLADVEKSSSHRIKDMMYKIDKMNGVAHMNINNKINEKDIVENLNGFYYNNDDTILVTNEPAVAVTATVVTESVINEKMLKENANNQLKSAVVEQNSIELDNRSKVRMGEMMLNSNEMNAISKCPFLRAQMGQQLEEEPKTKDVKKFLKLKNMSTQAEYYDGLYPNVQPNGKTIKDIKGCQQGLCKGSLMFDGNFKLLGTEMRNIDEIFNDAKTFYTEYYQSKESLNSNEHVLRLQNIQNDLNEMGYYMMTEDELGYGAKLAWRNASRCIGRIQWSKLQLFDCRHVKTTREMFDAICTHIKYATNDGNLRAGITIFPQRIKGRKDFRIWNSQFISYAGHTQKDGSILGDPNNVQFTNLCVSLGWKPKRTQWEILPMVVSNGNGPDLYEYPEDLILTVPLTHPKFEWFADLNLQWYAIPAVSNMLFDCGGIQYPGTGFNGWYMSTEIGCRNLCDENRINITEKVAINMNLDTSTLTSLWKDQVLVEVNIAVLHSFNLHNVTIVDHHSASDSFMKHMENETKLRRGCPSDWVWIVPPMSSSMTTVFHQEMALYHLKPSYEYQKSPYSIWLMEQPRKKFHFKIIASSVLFASILYKTMLKRRINVKILYATETGKSEQYANQLEKLFINNFNTSVECMANYDISQLKNESIVIGITSTFGNGDPPENGEEFKDNITELKYGDEVDGLEKEISRAAAIQWNGEQQQTTGKPLKKLHFAIFALGSSAYPNYCAFGKYLNTILEELGGNRILDISCGDELAGQEKSYRKWAPQVYKSTCDAFNIKYDRETMNAITMLADDQSSMNGMALQENDVRLMSMRSTKSLALQLSKFHNKNILVCKAKENSIKLHIDECNSNNDGDGDIKSTILVKLSLDKNVRYEPGDHIGIYPINRQELVDDILEKFQDDINAYEDDIQLQIRKKINENNENWENLDRIPNTSIRTLLSRFYDITTPPSMELLQFLSQYCSNNNDKNCLIQLSTDQNEYMKWRQLMYPTLLDVLNEFESCKPPVTLLLLQLLPLQPRFYSISSSLQMYKKALHLTVAVVKYTITKEKIKHYGVCSTYLNDLKINDSVHFFIRKANNFHLPSVESKKPIILIGPGTGIAPFRSFWQQLELTRYDSKVLLFSGCRTKEMDLYGDEKRVLLEKGVLDKSFVAYSREENIPKTYVQDLLKTEADTLYKLIQLEGGHIYVCGDIMMAEEVYKTIINIISTKENKTQGETEKILYYMKKQNRYHEDIFGVAYRPATESTSTTTTSSQPRAINQS